MSNIGDLTTDLTADFGAQIVAEDGRDRAVDDANWFQGQSIPRKLTLIYAAQSAMAVLIGCAAWYGLAHIASELEAASPAIAASLADEIRATGLVVLGVIVAAVLVGLAGLHRVRHDIATCITDLSRTMTALSKGNFDFEIANGARADEFGDMARAMETFRRGGLKLRRIREKEIKNAQGEAEEQQRAAEENREILERHRASLGRVADEFDKTIGEVVSGVAAAASELQATATSMAANADQSLRQSERVGDALSEATAGVTAAAAASEEFALSIGEISRQATTSAELARKASGAAVDANETMSALTESAAEVGKVVELISHIAQRTNLLALNASIEAARGGEAGRGFAVVAAEVKELATQTGKATEEVAKQIRAMQDTTGASVGALKSIADHIGELETTSVSIAAAVDQQSNAGRDLARSIDLAARGAEDVTSSIVQVQEASRATGTVASQVLASSTELERQATFLRVQAGDFTSRVRKS